MLKGNFKAQTCSLCFNTECDIDLEVVEVIKEVLEIVLPKLNLKEGDEHLICSSCSVKLFAAFNFKSVCTDTEDTIFPYVNSQETSLVDLREIYLKKKGDILENQKICRLCFQSVEYGFVSLNEVDADIIDNYIPEVNFNVTKDPVICKVCSDSLVTHGTFLSSCLAAQEENRKVCGDPAEDGECCIKIEETKIEDEDEESDPPTRLENVETIKDFYDRFSSRNIPVDNKKRPPRKLRTYKCNKCDFKTVHKCSLKRHCLKHVSLTITYISSKSKNRDTSSPCPLEDQERMFQCEKCPYTTHLRYTFARHSWTHQVPSEVKVYQCEKCYYRVTRMDHFRLHQLTHEDSAEKYKKRPPGKVRTYKCNKCEFKTVHRYSINRHCLKHKVSLTRKTPKSRCERKSRDASLPCPLRNQEGMYECKKCRYKTHLRRAFTSHWRTHEVSSYVYHCKECHYRAIRKDHFVRHQLRHKDGGKVQIHTCDICGFQTRYKKILVKHQLGHKTKVRKYIKCYTTGDGEITYKCDICKYETRDNSQLLIHPYHKLKFNCYMCAYESNNKTNFIRHQLTHSLGAKTYKCNMCSYQTIWKNNLVRHQLSHKNINEVKKYDCDKCSFKSKYKECLKRHMLKHSVLK